MQIIYVPSGKGDTFSPTSFKEIITAAEKFNPYDQKQYKRFIFCNMTAEEEKIVRGQLKEDLSEQSGVPQSKILKNQPKQDYIYLKDIGNVKLR